MLLLHHWGYVISVIIVAVKRFLQLGSTADNYSPLAAGLLLFDLRTNFQIGGSFGLLLYIKVQKISNVPKAGTCTGFRISD